jgi:hypothetical protein
MGPSICLSVCHVFPMGEETFITGESLLHNSEKRGHCWNTLLHSNEKRAIVGILVQQWPPIIVQEWPEVQQWLTCCGMKNTFLMSVYSKESTFPALYHCHSTVRDQVSHPCKITDFCVNQNVKSSDLDMIKSKYWYKVSCHALLKV